VREMAVSFEKLGHLLESGVPFLQAVEAVAEECRDDVVGKAFSDIHGRVSGRQEVGDILGEYGRTFPRTVQLLWKVGQKADLDKCCLRIASILRSDLTQ
jgi:type II secretory pathway component PulF